MNALKSFAIASLASLALSTAALADGQKILSIVTAENNESQAMALVLANQAQAAGNSVHMLLCGPAGDIALKTPPKSATEVVTPKGMSVRKLMGGLLQKGGKIEVCAIYLPNRKLAPDALMPGVGVAQPKPIAAMLADDDVKVVGN